MRPGIRNGVEDLESLSHDRSAVKLELLASGLQNGLIVCEVWRWRVRGHHRWSSIFKHAILRRLNDHGTFNGLVVWASVDSA